MDYIPFQNGEQMGSVRTKINTAFENIFPKEYAYCYISSDTGVTTSLNDNTQWYEVQGAYTCPVGLTQGFTPTASELIYNGVSGKFKIDISFSFSASKGALIKLGIKLNGVLQEPKTRRVIALPTDTGNCSLIFGAELSQNDTIQIVVNSDKELNVLNTYDIQAGILKVDG